MLILGIHDGHNCGATLVRDGIIIASICEERLTRVKNEVGYPKLSIEEVLKIGKVEKEKLDLVAYASLFMHAQEYLTELDGWYDVGLADQRKEKEKPKDYQKLIFDERKKERLAQASKHLGVPEENIKFVEHHLAHVAAAYYTAPNVKTGKPVLGLTCDGAGDRVSATVSICKDNDISRLSETDRHASLGKIYSRATFLMGMKPWEHEFKLMGMAPYAEEKRANKAAEPLRQLLKISEDGLGFALAGELSTNFCYEYLRDSFERIRFDTIAGAIQIFTEEMLVEWVKSCVRHTGITDLVCGGGVFMNVKANMLIAELPEVTSVHVMPSAGDESLSFGAALHHHYQATGELDHNKSILTDLYLGGDYTAAEESSAIKDKLVDQPVQIIEPANMNAAIAELLADGEIVASCRGRMEWGARSLGNRSILASADDFRRVDIINKMIKMRDFWMPFAPSIKEESAARYFDDDKKINPWFMTHAFRSNPQTVSDVVAATQPRDLTMRPQVVTRKANPDYHEVIDRFEKATGRGAVLNTSFNLHGEPIVRTPEDAIRVFLKSGLKHLALNNHLISKSDG